MASNKENINKLNYCIKLLAGNNVVLVDASNYESEIFVPQIVDGRITFQNIIPNRRCCQHEGKTMKCNPNVQRNITRPLLTRIVAPRSDRSMPRLNGGQETELPIPLASSTPAVVNRINQEILKANCGNVLSTGLGVAPNPYTSVNNSSLPTPEPVRKAVPASQKVLNNSPMHFPRGIKVLPLYHDSMNTPKKLGRLVATSSKGSQELSILNGSFSLPRTPSMSNIARGKSTSSHSPNNLQTTLESVGKWRKVITPMRTYTRRFDKPVMVRRSTPAASAKKSFRSRKVIPTYLVNPTQAPKVTHKVEMMKNKLIIDNKVRISPRTFKKQQRQPMAAALNLPHRTSLPTKIKLQTEPTLALEKSRHQLKSLQISAFDLLTNSSRFRCMNDNLNKQFRNGCINKASSTYNKYKLLTNVPPLQRDEQILDLSRNTLPKYDASCQHYNRTKTISTQIKLHSSADIRTGFKL